MKFSVILSTIVHIIIIFRYLKIIIIHSHNLACQLYSQFLSSAYNIGFLKIFFLLRSLHWFTSPLLLIYVVALRRFLPLATNKLSSQDFLKIRLGLSHSFALTSLNSKFNVRLQGRRTRRTTVSSYTGLNYLFLVSSVISFRHNLQYNLVDCV